MGCLLEQSVSPMEQKLDKQDSRKPIAFCQSADSEMACLAICSQLVAIACGPFICSGSWSKMRQEGGVNRKINFRAAENNETKQTIFELKTNTFHRTFSGSNGVQIAQKRALQKQ